MRSPWSAVSWLMSPEGDGDFGEYRRLILAELQRLSDGISEVKGQVSALHSLELAGIKAEIAVLKFKSGLWGFAAGAIPGAIALIYSMIKH